MNVEVKLKENTEESGLFYFFIFVSSEFDFFALREVINVGLHMLVG